MKILSNSMKGGISLVTHYMRSKLLTLVDGMRCVTVKIPSFFVSIPSQDLYKKLKVIFCRPQEAGGIRGVDDSER